MEAGTLVTTLDETESQFRARSVHLPESQWTWLYQRAAKTTSRSISFELRRLVATEMEKEARESVLAAA